jgi:predicted anti-sigma-YlaC factor YlaD
MLTSFPPNDCAQAREAASVRLDNELSELDAARLDVHLGTCAECSNYAREIEILTAELRAATLERPGNSVVLPNRRRIPMRAAAAAAAVVALLTVSSLALGRAFNGRGSPAQTVTGSTFSTGIHADANANEQHLMAQLHGFEQVPVGQLGRVTVI